MSNQPDKEDIERIQLFEACRQVEHHLRALREKSLSVSIYSDMVSISSPLWTSTFAGDSLFDAITYAQGSKPT